MKLKRYFSRTNSSSSTRPKYNINLKDAKTFAYIALTREPFPRILTSRKVSRKLESFGPYTDGFTRQDLQRLVVRVFKLRTCRKLPKRACLNFHIGLCSAPCNGNVVPEQYTKLVEEARSFLGGNYDQTIKLLLAQMQDASQNTTVRTRFGNPQPNCIYPVADATANRR